MMLQFIILDAEFYQKPDFWIFLIIGVAGLIYSIASFVQATDAKKEATLAKDAAVEAGKLVKIQNVSNEVMEIIASCQIDAAEDTTLVKVSPKINHLSGRISRVIALLEEESKNNPTQKELLEGIKLTITALRTSLNTFNPSLTNAALNADGPAIFNALEPNLGYLQVQLNSLAGCLQNTLSVPKNK